MLIRLLKSLFATSLLLVVGCSTLLKSPGGNLLSEKEAIREYSKVLETYVNDTGEVDFIGISQNMASLNAYINFISETPFSNFKTKEALLAHYINSYNALSIYTVIKRDFPESHAGMNKVGFFYLTKMKIGGKEMSLYTYENDFIRKTNEEKVHFALNCMAISCPRLPKTPFTAKDIDGELLKATKFFFSEPRNLKVDHKEKEVMVSEILSFFTEDFVPSKAESLISYINKYIYEKIPQDYEVDFIDYNWTVIKQ